MFRRFFAVTMFWVLRPLVWGFAIAMIALFGFQWYWLESHPRHQSVSVLPNVPMPQPHVGWTVTAIAQNRFQKTDWSKVRSVTAWNGAEDLAQLWEPGAMPELRHLTFMNGSNEQMVRLLELHDPESLVVGDYKLSAEAWEKIASEPRLRFLQVYGGSNQQTGPAPHKYPPQLDTLQFFGLRSPGEDGLLSLKGHPSLRTLYATFRPSTGTGNLSAQDLELVRSLPRLETLYLADSVGAATEVQKQLPHIRVRQAHIDSTRILFTLLTLLGGLLLTVLVVAQFSTAMAIPMSALAPRYNIPHLGFSVVVWVLGCAVQVLVLYKIGVELTAIVGIVALPLIFQALTLLALRQAHPATPGAVQPLYSAPLLFFWLVGLAMFAGAQSSEFDWWLGGNRPDVTVALIALGAACGIWLIWHFHRTQRRMEATGCQGMPLGPLDVTAWKVWQQSARGPRELTRNGWRPGGWLTDRQLSRVIAAGYTGDPARRAALWSLASPAGWRVTASLAALAVTMGITPLVLAAWNLGVQPWMTGMFVAGPSMLTSMLVFLPLQSLHMRRSFFSRECLLPVSREVWIRIVLTEAALRMSVAVAVALVYALSAWLIFGRPALPVSVLTAGLPTVAGLFLLVFGLGIWQESYRFGWVAAAGACAGVFSLSIVVMLTLDNNKGVWVEAFLTSAPLTHTAALACLVAGYLSVRTGIRRWQRWELGRIA